ncbi:MAG TPA: lipoprotein [Rudaea sp.]|nr:lipoprotein [Rudaea sp.]
MPQSLRYSSMLLVATLALGGCGNKGPLVLPDQAPATKAHTSSPQAPAQDTKSRPEFPR